MDFKEILYNVDNGVATLTLNRPEVSNGFNIPICEEILKAIDTAKKDDTVQILLINANGKVFSVGGDLVEMQRAVDADDVQSLVRIAELVNKISFALKRLPKPVVMSTDGAVAGAAANIAVAADFCIASDKTRFIQAFVNVGLAPDAGGLFLLTRAIGITRATQLAMTGEALNAEKALEYGIVYKVCEPEKLEKITDRVITRLKRGSVNSYKAIKEMVWQSSFAGWQEYEDLELELQKSLAFTNDFKEGVRAYTEKRRPKFTGK
ncbi:enoyl-CoA hydratase [Streptococcus mutans]|uniref:enoyl-CoA hydratase n=1 Tax=Streptococcus mutans TaxID=1309 RepID=UPI0002B5F4B7|nr:enoyl-CoA hydratase [Streptococcus mutans]RKV87323.1 MAG: enoyl-CoA hydratase [Streptococcus sp.]ARS62984.1 enoyl-CoA hydratase [Streptococcus mutans]EMB78605.1 enoyl-CoA hydratase [Streptococcus mutans 5SM3]EMC29250.1 enoyl-CoA hydratase [Streptococcus mutans ST6]MCB4951501.1 enoyl-CoA hydratase [Streptococcus mutans]